MSAPLNVLSVSGSQGGATGSDTVPGSAKCSLVRIQMIGHVRAGKKNPVQPAWQQQAERKKERQTERERENTICV